MKIVYFLILFYAAVGFSDEKTLRIGTTQSLWRDFLATSTRTYDQQSFRMLLHPPILNWSEANGWQCYVCESFPPLFENEKINFGGKEVNALKVVLSIRRDLKWGDGQELSRDDYILAFKVLSSQTSSSDFSGDMPLLVEGDPSKKNILKVYFNPNQWSLWDLIYLPALPSLKFAEQTLKAKDQSLSLIAEMYRRLQPDPGLFAGPYVVSSFDAQQITLEPNKYFKVSARLSFQKVHFQKYERLVQLLDAFSSQKIDQIHETEINVFRTKLGSEIQKFSKYFPSPFAVRFISKDLATLNNISLRSRNTQENWLSLVKKSLSADKKFVINEGSLIYQEYCAASTKNPNAEVRHSPWKILVKSKLDSTLNDRLFSALLMEFKKQNVDLILQNSLKSASLVTLDQGFDALWNMRLMDGILLPCFMAGEKQKADLNQGLILGYLPKVIVSRLHEDLKIPSSALPWSAVFYTKE